MKNLLTAVSILLLASSCSKNKSDKTIIYEIDENRSIIEWKGSAPDHFHVGAFDVHGRFQARKGLLLDGAFDIPIASIRNFDLPEPVKPELLNHLKSADFFNIALHPTAHFSIEKVIPNPGTPAEPVYDVFGKFTMLGMTEPVEFPAKIETLEDSITVRAAFSINRLKWGMNSYSDPGGTLYILPDVALTLLLRAAIEK